MLSIFRASKLKSVYTYEYNSIGKPLTSLIIKKEGVPQPDSNNNFMTIYCKLIFYI